MKRKKLETTIVGIQDLESTIKNLKEEYGENTQIDVLECSLMKMTFYVTIWRM